MVFTKPQACSTDVCSNPDEHLRKHLIQVLDLDFYAWMYDVIVCGGVGKKDIGRARKREKERDSKQEREQRNNAGGRERVRDVERRRNTDRWFKGLKKIERVT